MRELVDKSPPPNYSIELSHPPPPPPLFFFKVCMHKTDMGVKGWSARMEGGVGGGGGDGSSRGGGEAGKGGLGRWGGGGGGRVREGRCAAGVG